MPYLYGFASTLYGEALIVTRNNYLLALGFTSNLGAVASKHWPAASNVRDDEMAIAMWEKIVNNKRIPCVLYGTDFQRSVWQALLDIPWSKKSTYRDIAIAVERPKAVRAVGSAIGANPISYLIPCHRILRSNGRAGGYRWGLETKTKLLQAEIYVC